VKTQPKTLPIKEKENFAKNVTEKEESLWGWIVLRQATHQQQKQRGRGTTKGGYGRGGNIRLKSKYGSNKTTPNLGKKKGGYLVRKKEKKLMRRKHHEVENIKTTRRERTRKKRIPRGS